jgi:hypothetical protein
VLQIVNAAIPVATKCMGFSNVQLRKSRRTAIKALPEAPAKLYRGNPSLHPESDGCTAAL